jgi:hypothetical protein
MAPMGECWKCPLITRREGGTFARAQSSLWMTAGSRTAINALMASNALMSHPDPDAPANLTPIQVGEVFENLRYR